MNPALAAALRKEAEYKEGGWNTACRDLLRKVADILDGEKVEPFMYVPKGKNDV